MGERSESGLSIRRRSGSDYQSTTGKGKVWRIYIVVVALRLSSVWQLCGIAYLLVKEEKVIGNLIKWN